MRRKDNPDAKVLSYHEAVMIRYRNLNFLLRHRRILSHLRGRLLVDHFQAIRHVETVLKMGPTLPVYAAQAQPERRTSWARLWLTLASMQGLRHVKFAFIIQYGSRAVHSRQGHTLLQPVRKLLTHVQDVEWGSPGKGGDSIFNLAHCSRMEWWNAVLLSLIWPITIDFWCPALAVELSHRKELLAALSRVAVLGQILDCNSVTIHSFEALE